MSTNYELVLSFYLRGLWDEARVRNAVNRWITEEEANTILASK